MRAGGRLLASWHLLTLGHAFGPADSECSAPGACSAGEPAAGTLDRGGGAAWTSTAAASSKDEVQSKSVKELRELISRCGLSCRGCLEKSEFQLRAIEALEQSKVGRCVAPVHRSASTHSDSKWRRKHAHRRKGLSEDQSNGVGRNSQERGSTNNRRKSGGGHSSDSAASRNVAGLKMKLLPHSARELDKASPPELRRTIRHHGLDHRDCFGRDELQRRAREALLRPRPLPKPGVIRRRGHAAHVLTPKGLRRGDPMPLLLVLHGAGRTEEGLKRMVLQYSKVASRKRCIIIVPSSLSSTWDLMQYMKQGTASKDTHFLASILDDMGRDYYIDNERIGVLGFSDGASYAITLAVNNAEVFQSAMAWSAGYYHDESGYSHPPSTRRPTILHGHGQVDTLFDFWKIALPMRQRLRSSGYAVKSYTKKAAGHGTPPEFVEAAIDWWLALPRNAKARGPEWGH